MQLNIYDKNAPAAVKAYQQSVGLKVDGIVGINTWKSLGLIYRKVEDINAGITIVTQGLKQYKDVSVPITNALINAEETFKKHRLNFDWFYKQVKPFAPWDIKVDYIWNDTIAEGTYPGSYSTQVILYGEKTTPEAIGNITYGYLGTAAGFTKAMLLQGGDAAANGVNMNVKGIYKGMQGILKSADSEEDKENIIKGINMYRK